MKEEQIVEILDKHLRLMILNSIERFNDLKEMKKLPEYNACLNAMIEIAEAVKNNTLPTPDKPDPSHCACSERQKHGETSVMCCNECGKPTEKFWSRG